MVLLSIQAGEVAVTVIDADLDIPLEGVLLRLTGRDEPVYTDRNGRGVITVPAGSRRNVLTAQLPGYDPMRLPFGADDAELLLELSMTGFVEGEELVVEGSAPQADESESGVSVALTRNDMDTTANMGIMPDVMSSVKTLPGVGYTAGYSAEPSVRGGYPEELAVTLDGFYVTYPFQWGGSVSVFNPSMVESAKLSHGVFSARYGRAISGLLEIETVIPDEPRLRIDASLSSIATDLYLQAPTGEYSGLFIGGKITYMDYMSLLPLEELEGIDPMPYIRNAYGKWDWSSPNSRLNLFFNGFIGTDGMGYDMAIEEDGITYDLLFEYWYTNSFISGGFGWALNDRWRLDAVGGYNNNLTESEYDAGNRGTLSYSQAFLDEYDDDGIIDTDGVPGTINGSSTFSIDGINDEGTGESKLHQGQLKITAERLIGDSHVVAFGVEEVMGYMEGYSDYDGYFDYWNEALVPPRFELQPYAFDMTTKGNKTLNSALFLLWEFGLDRSSRLSGEVGIRGEHYYLWNDDFDMISQPVAVPRFSITWRALEGGKELDHLDFTLGSGLFANTRLETTMADSDLRLDTEEFLPDRVLSTLLGMEAAWKRGWSFSLEGYYKYYLNRMIITGEDDGSGGTDLFVNTDGTGHVAGFDFMIRKKIGRKLDGYLSYSFIYARFYNPSNTGNTGEEDYLNYEPLDTWFYPYYHRFHNLNLVLNWRPWDKWTFSLIGSLATGAPREDVGDIEFYPAEYPASSGNYIERYSRTSAYSDTLRNSVSVPIDIRIAYGSYLKRKMRLEVFLAVEDVLSPLYTPKGNYFFNPVTGEEEKEISADFTLGIPTISFGLKVSY